MDVPSATVTVGSAGDLLVDATPVEGFAWADGPVSGPVLVQASAHGPADEAELVDDEVRWAAPHRRVAPGQSVVFYDGDQVLGTRRVDVELPGQAFEVVGSAERCSVGDSNGHLFSQGPVDKYLVHGAVGDIGATGGAGRNPTGDQRLG